MAVTKDIGGLAKLTYTDASDAAEQYRYIDPWPDVSERAKIRIYHDKVGMITGLMPEELSFGQSNVWRTPFATILADFNTGFQAMQEALGNEADTKYSSLLKELTGNIWGGGSELATSFRLLYIARKDALNDVVAPLRFFIRLSAGTLGAQAKLEINTKTPRSFSATVLSPPNSVQVEFGRFLSLKKAVITRLSWRTPNVTDGTGAPHWLIVELGIKTKRVLMGDDDEVEILGTPLRTKS